MVPNLLHPQLTASLFHMFGIKGRDDGSVTVMVEHGHIWLSDTVIVEHKQFIVFIYQT